jgi:serine/threonine protein kinase
MKRTRANESSRREIEAHKAVLGLDGFPQIVDSFEDAGYSYMVLSRLGPSIETIRSFGGTVVRLSEETIGSIGLQMVDRLETLHGRGFVHLDMYPNNIAVGDGESGKYQLYLFDFGEARQYIISATGELELSLQKTRKFDIQSLSHSILQLMKPGTPYGDLNHLDAGISLETLCEGLPNAVLRLFKYSHETLGLHESPNYSFLRSLLRELVPSYNGALIWN